MNILLINHYAGSTRHGMEFRAFYFAREWLALGHKVQIVAASYSHIRVNQPDMSDSIMMDEMIDGIAYRWYATPPYKGNGAKRVFNMITFLRALKRNAERLVREFRPDIVIASSTYPMDIRSAHRIAKLANAKLVFEVHDLWPLSPMELGNMSKWHPFILWVQAAENYACRNADVIVSMLPKTKEHLISHGMRQEKFVYVPNGIDTSEWKAPQSMPKEVSTAIAQVKQKGLPLVGYIGTHGLANALDTLLDVAKLMQEEVSFVLIGKGPERDRLFERVENEQISNVTMLPAILKKSVPSFLAEIDIAYIGWHKNPLYRFGISPNKIFDYMMAAKPIVHAVEAGNDPVAEAGCGLTTPPDDLHAIRKAILDITKLPPEERKAMGDNGRQFVLTERTYPVLAKRFLEAVENG